MKKIIRNKLYDTEKAEKIYSFRQRRKTGSFGDLNIYKWFDIDIYKTKKNNYFFYGSKEDNQFIEEVSEKEVKSIIKELNADKYIELFGEVEEA